MKYLTFMALIFSFEVHAHKHDSNCTPNHALDIQDIKKLLEWNGASENQIRNAPCKTKEAPSQEEMLAFIASKSQGSAQSTVNGVKFQGESPKLVSAFQDFTTAKDSFGQNNQKENQKKIQADYQINPSCDKVLCAMEKIWGKEQAVKMLYIKLKHNYNTSELAFADSDRFTKEELDHVLIGLEDIPSHLTPMGTNNQRLTHFTRGYTLKDYSETVLANAVVMLFDSWDRETDESKQYTIFHEVAHNISSRYKNMDESPAWLNLSGWIKKGDVWSATPSACFVSKYGITNPWEDFAEVVSAYRYNGSGLKETCPGKYAFVKNMVFKDIEYTETRLCSPIPEARLEVARNSIAKELARTIEDRSFSPEEINEACKGMIQNYPIDSTEVSLCGVKLHSKSAATSNLVKEVMRNLGIPITNANQNLILEGLIDKVLIDDTLQIEISKKMMKLNDGLNQMIEKSFEESNQFTKPLTADDYNWRLNFEKCASGLFDGKPDESLQCQAKQIVAHDRNMQKFKAGYFPSFEPPAVFAASAKEILSQKREEKLTQFLLKEPVAQEVKASMVKDFKDQMKFHHYHSTRKINQLSGWRRMSPQEFCEKTYGQGSPITVIYGVESGKSIPSFTRLCVEAQAGKSRRFEFKESDWNGMIEALVPGK